MRYFIGILALLLLSAAALFGRRHVGQSWQLAAYGLMMLGLSVASGIVTVCTDGFVGKITFIWVGLFLIIAILSFVASGFSWL